MKDEFDRQEPIKEQNSELDEQQVIEPTDFAAEQNESVDMPIEEESVESYEIPEEDWTDYAEEQSELVERTNEETQAEQPVQEARGEEWTDIQEERQIQPEQSGPVPGETPSPVSPRKKHRAGRIVSFIAIVMAAFLLGGLVGGYLVMPTIQGAGQNVTVGTQDTPEQPEETAEPSPAPSFGGTAPAITSQDNPVVDIAKSVGPSVVSIEMRTVEYTAGEVPTVTSYSRGTGFIISEDGYILTNAHVVAEGNEIIVSLADETEYTAELKGADSALDIALIKIDAQGLTPVAIGDSESVQTGEIAVAIGNPYGMGQSLTGTVTVGYISAAKREINFNSQIVEAIQTDAAINPGNSGGPLVNIKGEVIGITNMKTMLIGYDEYGNQINTEGLGFAVPINVAMDTAKEIIENGG